MPRALLTTLLLLAPFAAAQGAKPKPKPKPEMDELSRETWDRFEKLEYHLGRVGVDKVDFKVDVDSKSPLGAAKATGTYKFQNGKGALSWSDARLGPMLAERGWSAQTLDLLFVPDGERRLLSGCKLTAEKRGDVTVISVEGDSGPGFRELHFDARGLVTRVVVAGRSEGDKDAVVTLHWQELGRRYLRTSWSMQVETKEGAMRGEMKITHKQVGRFHVFDAVEETLTLGETDLGTQRLSFHGYLINGKIKEEKTGEPEGAPGSKPAPRPAGESPPQPAEVPPVPVPLPPGGHKHK